MSVVRNVFTAFLAGASCACAAPGPLSPSELAALERAEARWVAAGVRNYDFEYRSACFCPVELTQWTRLEVRNGLFSRAIALGPLVSQEAVDRFPWWPTIDSLFVRIRGGMRGSHLKDVSFAFDPVWGFPVEVSFTELPTVADGGSAFFVRGFVPR